MGNAHKKASVDMPVWKMKPEDAEMLREASSTKPTLKAGRAMTRQNTPRGRLAISGMLVVACLCLCTIGCVVAPRCGGLAGGIAAVAFLQLVSGLLAGLWIGRREVDAKLRPLRTEIDGMVKGLKPPESIVDWIRREIAEHGCEDRAALIEKVKNQFKYPDTVGVDRAERWIEEAIRVPEPSPAQAIKYCNYTFGPPSISNYSQVQIPLAYLNELAAKKATEIKP